jgi:hypothetical protein
MNLDKLPPKIQEKIDSGKSLTKKEEDLFWGLKEMRHDLAKTPKERTKRGNWKELHEINECAMILGSDDLSVKLFSDGSEEEQDLDDENKKPSAAKETTKPDKDRAVKIFMDEMDSTTDFEVFFFLGR